MKHVFEIDPYLAENNHAFFEILHEMPIAPFLRNIELAIREGDPL